MPDRIAELKSRPRDKVVVVLAGGRFFTIPSEQAHSLSLDLELTDAEIDHLDRMDQYFRAHEKALRMVSTRSRTKWEVKKALIGMEISESVRDGILREFVELGLLDDARFTREFVQTKVEVRFMGPHRLRFDLGKLGVHREIIDQVLADELNTESQEATAWALVERKLRRAPLDERSVRRMAALLQRKGFDYEIVNRVSFELLRRSKKDAADASEEI